jgi:hypothetical protein
VGRPAGAACRSPTRRREPAAAPVPGRPAAGRPDARCRRSSPAGAARTARCRPSPRSDAGSVRWAARRPGGAAAPAATARQPLRSPRPAPPVAALRSVAPTPHCGGESATAVPMRRSVAGRSQRPSDGNQGVQCPPRRWVQAAVGRDGVQGQRHRRNAGVKQTRF